MPRKVLFVFVLLAILVFSLSEVCFAAIREIHLKGTINNNIKIHMVLSVLGSQVSGEYYYDEYKKPIYLYGEFNDSGYILYENSESEGVTGSFAGQFISTTKFQGVWRDKYYLKKLPFALESYEEFTRPDNGSLLSIKFKDSNLLIDHKGKSVSINLKPFLNAQGEYHCLLLYQAYKQDNYYLLVDGGGSTLEHSSPKGQAGCGYENNMIWLKLDKELSIIDKQSIHYASYSGIDPDMRIINKDSITLTFVNYLEEKGVEKTYVYDNNNPEKGLVLISKKPLR